MDDDIQMTAIVGDERFCETCGQALGPVDDPHELVDCIKSLAARVQDLEERPPA